MMNAGKNGFLKNDSKKLSAISFSSFSSVLTLIYVRRSPVAIEMICQLLGPVDELIRLFPPDISSCCQIVMAMLK